MHRFKDLHRLLQFDADRIELDFYTGRVVANAGDLISISNETELSDEAIA